MSALNQEKADKKRHVKVQGVPLDGTTPDEVSAEAKQKNCAYLVFTTLVELQGSTGGAMSRRGTMPPDPGGVYSPPNGRQMGGLNAEYEASVEYRLYRSGDPSAISSGPVSNREVMPASEVIARVMDQIASRVSGEIKKTHQRFSRSFCYEHCPVIAAILLVPPATGEYNSAEFNKAGT